MKSTSKVGRQAQSGKKRFPPVPAVYTRRESNPFVQHMKAKVRKKVNFHYRSVFDQRDLALCLLALGRSADALRIVDYAHRHVEFRGKYDAWYAAASACCVAAYIRRKDGRDKQAARDLRRFIDQPAHALLIQTKVWTPAFVREHIQEERERFERNFDNPKPAYAIEAMTWWAATLIFFREMALAGFPRQGRPSVKRFDSWTEDALHRIRDKLHSLSGQSQPKE